MLYKKSACVGHYRDDDLDIRTKIEKTSIFESDLELLFGLVVCLLLLLFVFLVPRNYIIIPLIFEN